MLRRFAVLLLRSLRLSRRPVGEVEGVGSISYETAQEVRPKQAMERQFACFQTDEVFDGGLCTDAETAISCDKSCTSSEAGFAGDGPYSETEAEFTADGLCGDSEVDFVGHELCAESGSDAVYNRTCAKFDVTSFDEDTSVHSNATNDNTDRWATIYSSDTEAWCDRGDEPSAKFDAVTDRRPSTELYNNTVGQKDCGVVGVASVGGKPSVELDPAILGRWPSVDFKYDTSIGEILCTDREITSFSEGSSYEFDAVSGGDAPAVMGPDADVVAETQSIDATGAESDFTSVSEVFDNQRSVNDVWEPAFSSDPETWEDIDEESSAYLSGFGKQPNVQSTVVSLSEQRRIESNVVSFGKQPTAQSNTVAQSSTATHPYTTVFINDSEGDEEFTADARMTSAEFSGSSASVLAEETVDPGDEVDGSLVGKTYADSAATTDREWSDVNLEKHEVESEVVRVGYEPNAQPEANNVDRVLSVVDDEPLMWIKSREDFDWEGDSDIDSKPPFRLICGCFPRIRRQSRQLCRYRTKKVTKERVHREQEEAQDKNFVEIKYPKRSCRGLSKSH